MYIFIMNPIAGKGRAKTIYAKLQKNEYFQKLNTVSFCTKYKGHAEEIAKSLHRKYRETDITLIVVIGGDGTMHEVINGLKNKQIPISFIPSGSGNDFARGTSTPKNINKLMQNIYETNTSVPYWFGSYLSKNGEKRNFVNCLGFGFDAVVAQQANQSKIKKVFNRLRCGSLVYLYALIRSLFTFKPFIIKMELDQRTKVFKRCFLLTINNHPYFGGGMKINPQARNNGEHFSILVIDSISKWKVLALFFTVFFGKHLHFKEVSTYTAQKITCYANHSIPYQVDGETGSTSFCTMIKQPLPMQVKGCSKMVQNNRNHIN
ncbi:diacylglycerol/lipid kinase family protein [Pseudogracilibacillus auburnensis]|uniref:YegS/Rv2252/BmrU family lipid kinase n=1 Tax=Pseudogracilibacillus auburnensis TaxID=1494959 RepID=A0A2V3VGD5_9BACI|nr:diacylglycerol kinase family protein [Pseudogracilibacillus auburnensis]MBO1003285.1 diacylglycerol kinase family lipid kinase [Pseudogracilibacillus auburnensis]PXW80863.1 YegS/Rv2252/BmrU family lipid kinase [Pseudogracilibacillus auburnensis]